MLRPYLPGGRLRQGIDDCDAARHEESDETGSLLRRRERLPGLRFQLQESPVPPKPKVGGFVGRYIGFCASSRFR